MTTFNQFKFERVDGNSTLTLEVNVDVCQEIVDDLFLFCVALVSWMQAFMRLWKTQ
jgi:hypothetical protein